VTLGLAENSHLHNFSNAMTHGLLSVRMQALRTDWIMYGLKCLVATATAMASISQGIHDICRPRSLALKKPAMNDLLSLLIYKVAPMPGSLTAPSVTIHNWSVG
jgi:hypothetical protein